MTYTVFIIEDDPAQLKAISQAVQQRLGYRIITAQNGRDAVDRFLLRMEPRPDIILMDTTLPDIRGADIIRTIRRSAPQLPIIALSARLDQNYMADLVRAGASDILLKPLNADQLHLSIYNLLQRSVLNEEVQRLSRQQAGRVTFDDLSSQNERWHQAITQARRASETTIPVLITGEAGTDKEMLARAIHGSSIRAGMPFVSCHCSMLNDHSVTDMLQGSQAGSFGLAQNATGGLFQQAHGGTLLLKDIHCLPAKGQALLLEALQAANRPHWQKGQHDTANFRIIATTSCPTSDMLREGYLRDDLYFRLSAFPIQLPSLRDRLDDLPQLTTRILQQLAAYDETVARTIDAEALALLASYHWPGNISQLRQVLQKAVLVCQHATLQTEHIAMTLPDSAASTSHTTPAAWYQQTNGHSPHASLPILLEDGHVKSMDALEAEAIQFAIQHYNGKMTEVARRLGIGRSTLYRKISDYNLDDLRAA